MGRNMITLPLPTGQPRHAKHLYVETFYHEFAWNMYYIYMSSNKVTFVETQNYDYEY